MSSHNDDYEMQEVNRRWHRTAERTPCFYHLDYLPEPVDLNYNNRQRAGGSSLHNSRTMSDQDETINHDRISFDYTSPLDSENTDEYSDVYNRWQWDDQSELVNRHHRTTSIHRNAAIRERNESFTSRTIPRSLESRRKWMSPDGYVMKRTSLEQRANNIANRMEQDGALMEDSIESEQLRREALRDMPQCLTVKRIIKKKLNTSVNQQTKLQPLGFCKRFKYSTSMKVSKAQNSLKSLAYTFELWYSSLKIIEGHFGSGVATYFKFFRWLFIMNCLITFFTLGFIVLPQLLYVNVRPVQHYGEKLVIYDNSSNHTSVIAPLNWNQFKTKQSLKNNAPFSFSDFFTGEGYFTNTTLYYGFYTNNSVNLVKNVTYSMPHAYFFTMFCLYLISFIVVSMRMARSYRRSFIETQGGLKIVYAHKIFCGWDFSIANQDAADLKSSSIYQELKELLSDSFNKSVKVPIMQRFWTFMIQLIVNSVILIQLAGTGYVMWHLLEKHSSNDSESSAVATAVVINIIMMIFPSIFSFIVRYEDYKHPKAALYITLIRTFLLKIVVVGVFLAFWLTHSKNESCWETSIGQHIYRLILFDFLFSVVVAAVIEAVHYLIYKTIWKSIGAPTFDIARYTLQLMYNQTLFWVGLYFSPILSVVVILKLWCTWYLRRTCILCFCQPSSRSWRAAQTHTWFLMLSFLSLLLVLIAHGYIMVDVATSNCGPFRNYEYMYEMILKGIFQLEQNNMFWKVLMYFMKPGAVALILVAMCVIVYYLRARSFAQGDMVNILRDMLVLEAKDKEFLLKNISKATEGQWQYNLQERAPKVWDSFENSVAADVQKLKPKEHFDDHDEVSSNSANTPDYSRSHSSSSNLFLHNSPEASRDFVPRKKY